MNTFWGAMNSILEKSTCLLKIWALLNSSIVMLQRYSLAGWDRLKPEKIPVLILQIYFSITVFLFGEDPFWQWFILLRNFLYLITWEWFPGHQICHHVWIKYIWNHLWQAAPWAPLCWRTSRMLKIWDFCCCCWIQIKLLFLCMWCLCQAESAEKDVGFCWVLSCLRSTFEPWSVDSPKPYISTSSCSLYVCTQGRSSCALVLALCFSYIHSLFVFLNSGLEWNWWDTSEVKSLWELKRTTGNENDTKTINCVFPFQFNIGFVAASQTSVVCFLPH